MSLIWVKRTCCTFAGKQGLVLYKLTFTPLHCVYTHFRQLVHNELLPTPFFAHTTWSFTFPLHTIFGTIIHYFPFCSFHLQLLVYILNFHSTVFSCNSPHSALSRPDRVHTCIQQMPVQYGANFFTFLNTIIHQQHQSSTATVATYHSLILWTEHQHTFLTTTQLPCIKKRRCIIPCSG